MITGDDKIKSIAVKDNIFDGYTVTDTPTTVDDHYAIKFTNQSYEKVSVQRNVGQMFFTDLTANVNTNIGGPIFSSGTPLDSVGWRTYNSIGIDPGVSFTGTNEIRTCLDLQSFTNGSYYVMPFVINLPSYDGASGLAISFIVSSNINPSINVRVYAASQLGADRSQSLVVPTAVIYPVTNITNSVSNYFSTATGDQLMHIDISALYDTFYTSYISTDKYFPLWLYFVEESSPFTVVDVTKTSPTILEHIKVERITGQFRY